MNSQPTEHTDHQVRTIEIVSVYRSIQGEGPMAGMPSIFVRLAGCNLQCPLCDTDYTSNRRKVSHMQVVNAALSLMERQDLLVTITGGEPFRQNVETLVKLFNLASKRVLIETNGTLAPREEFKEFNRKVFVCCSPKTPVINPKLPITYYKYIISADSISDEDGLPNSVLGLSVKPARPRENEDVPIIIIPADEGDPDKNQKNMEAAIQVCQKFNYVLGMQLHKIWKLP